MMIPNDSIQGGPPGYSYKFHYKPSQILSVATLAINPS